MNWILAFVPMGIQILAMQLISKDKNDIGADDAIGQVLLNISPLIPDLVGGRSVNDNATDRTMLALYKTSEAYLINRGKLPGTTASSAVSRS